MNLSVVIYSIILWSWATEAHLLAKRAADCPKITDFSGRVKYRKKGQRAVFRCPKSFQRYGQRIANCQNNGTWDTKTPLCVKDGCIPLDASKVYNLDMDVKRGVVTFQCLENYVLVGESLIHCNGQTWSALLPRCAAPHELTECDFEVDLCGWIQDDNDQIDWIRNSGITPTGDTGPKHDHTYMTERSGHYMYFETSNPTETGDSAVLKSPSYPKSLSPICFDFWYHMEGPDDTGHVGDLDVYVIDESEFIDDDDVRPLLELSGNQGSEWKRGEIAIEEQDESFQIVIEAIKRNSYISDIAIDDVRLFNCTDNSTIGVTQSSTTPTTTTTIPTSSATSTPTTSIPSTAPTKSVTAPQETTEQPTTVVYTPSPTTPALSTQAPTKPTKQTTKAPTTRTTERTTTQSTTASTTLRPTTLKQTTPEPSTTRTTRLTTATRTMAVTTTSTLAPSTAAPPPTTTTAKINPTVASTTRTPVIVSTKRSTSRPTTSKPTKSSTIVSTTVLASLSPSSKTTTSASTSVTSSPITYRAPSTNKTSAANSPTVTTTISNPTQTPSIGTNTPKTTKRSNSITAKPPAVGNTTKDNAISVAEHDTLKPLMIGLGVGIVTGLIIIGVIAYVCVRRRKFYTSRYEDELKPITHAASNQSLNDDHFYKDEEYESES